MKTNKRELVALALSLLVLVIAGFLYLTFGSRQQHTFADKPSTSRISGTSTSSSDPSIESLEKKLAELEKQPTVNGIAALKKEIDSLTDVKTKEALQKRLVKIEQELPKIAKAIKSLEKAERTHDSQDIAKAEADINALSLPTKKAELQKRLTALMQGLDSVAAVAESQESSSSVEASESSSSQSSSNSLEATETDSMTESTPVVVTETPLSSEVPVYVPTAPTVLPVPAETPAVTPVITPEPSSTVVEETTTSSTVEEVLPSESVPAESSVEASSSAVEE